MRMSLRVPCLHQNGQPPPPPVPGLAQEWEWQLERSLAQRVLPEYGSGLCLGPVLRRLVDGFLPLSTFRCALDALPPRTFRAVDVEFGSSADEANEQLVRLVRVAGAPAGMGRASHP